MKLGNTLGAVMTAALIFSCARGHEPRPVKHASDEMRQMMADLTDDLHRCYEQHKVGGYIQARITIDDDGAIAAVDFDDKFAGTPTGRCVREVLMSKARFGPDDGPTIISYPLLLR